MSGNNSGAPTVTQGGQQQGTAPTLAERIEEIGKLQGVILLKSRAATERTGTKVKKSVEEKVQRAKDALSGTKSELDYVRRHTRLKESLGGYAGDPMMKSAVGTAKSALEKLPPVPLDGKTTEWAAPYVELGRVADALLKASQECEQQRQAAANNPLTQAVMKKIAETQAKLDERKLLQAQYESFSGVLRSLSADVVACVASKDTGKLKLAAKQLEGAASVVDLAIKAAATLLEKALARHTSLSRQLAASTLAEEQRLTVAGLLSAGEAAARAYDEAGATEKFDAAEKALGPTKKDLPTAKSVLDELAKKDSVKFKTNELVRNLGSTGQDPRTRKLYGAAVTLQTSIDSLQYMLEKGGDAVAGDAKRMLEAIKKEFDKLAAAKTFDPVAVGKAKSTEFDKLCQPVEAEASEFYKSSGAAEGYVGEFHGQIAALKLRLAENIKTANSEADLHFDQLGKELEALQKAIKQASGGEKPSPDQLAYQGAVNRFKRLIRTLDEQAGEVMSSDSDLAALLGLLGGPAQLRREGEQVANSEPLPDQMAKAAPSLEAVNKRIEAKLQEIAKAPRAAPPSADDLRQQCQALRTDYDRRLTDTLALVIQDAEKYALTRQLKSDQLEGLKEFGTALKKRVETLAAPAADGATSDKALLQDSKTALTGFEAEVKKFEEMGPGTKHVGGRKHFDDVTSLADEILKLLDHTRFGPRKDVTAEWRTTLNGIKKAPSKRDPDAVYGELTTMKGDVEQALKTAQTEHGEADKEKEVIQKLWDLITVPKDKDLEKKITTYNRTFAQFARECEQAIDMITTADKPDAGTLNRLKNKFDQLTTGSNDDLDKFEAPALMAEQGYEAALANLKQVIEVDIRLLREKAKEMTGEPGKEMAKQLDNAEKAARLAITNLKKTYDAKQAEAMYDSIVMRLRAVEDSPQGSKTNARNQLGQVEANWRAAVKAVHDRLDALPVIVKKECEPGGEAATKAADTLAVSLVKPVKDLFTADQFKAVVARFENGGETEILDAREDGLSEVRRLRRVMLADPLIRLASRNCPFPSAQVSFRPIESALMNFETNLNISDTVAS
jgi:hypothetical protein